MPNPLLGFWYHLLGADAQRARRLQRLPHASVTEASETIFLVLRRMRAPLILLITIFAISVLGLTLIPGQDAQGRPWRMGFFDSFYVMSYTASTIGFGEIPYSFTYAQRMWVTITIYLTVIGWAYAVGSLFAMVQDRAFRQALALQQFRRKVSRLREPFLLIVGYGQTGQLVGHAFDALDRRFVVIDISSERIDDLQLGSYRADVPGLVADARDPGHLVVAGLGHESCEAVLALTDDDEANLAVTMTAALLRPDLPVVARTTSSATAARMRAFGSPSVVNPFDVFGDHLRLALRAPASYQLLTWLEAGPGAELPPRGQVPRSGRWVVCGSGAVVEELTLDLRAEGLEVITVESGAPAPVAGQDGAVAPGSISETTASVEVEVRRAVGFIAGTDNDTSNLSLVVAARQSNPELFISAWQNRPANATLFEAMALDTLLVPTDVVAHEAYALLSTPLLRRFLREMPERGDEWAAGMVDRLTSLCGHHLQMLWKVALTAGEAPAVQPWLASGRARLGDLTRDPTERTERIPAVALMVLRGDDSALAPDDDFVLTAGDEILFAGRPAARRALDSTLLLDTAGEYVVSGRQVPSSWIWRRLTRHSGRRDPALPG
ncbi:NAD-binding protein [Mycobacterium sp. Y57]|uniref:NAD-binding protein n=1 Tax=Mycolicibacterium xanthum TaxID=2796469 RepID=UPI001C864F7E|nr:NAD-binding protein [Mycolicibacterium xanthum]MBX7432834.1 NAD-binding protein [Mycolicibacterium xanthum]